MPAITKTTCDNGGPVSPGAAAVFRDELITFAGVATLLAGTLLARRRVVTAITPSAVTGTGNGTVTAATVAAGTQVPKVGNWVLRCTAAATNGGTFRLEDPDGEIIVGGLTLTAGSGGANAFKAGGIAFTINDGSTDFAVNDTITLPVVAAGTLVPFSPTGVGGAQIPIAVLNYPLTSTGAGDIKSRVLVKGEVIKERLVIDADGTDANIDSTVLDQLRNYGITSKSTLQLAVLDP